MITIDGTPYSVPVVSVTRTADFLDKYAERTEDGVLHRELIGVYFNYKLKLGETKNMGAYQALWDALTEPTEFHTVVLPDESGDYTFTAYFANVSDELRLIEGSINYWHNLTVNFVAQSPARTP